MIILAHDGSLYGDWVARYALRFATAESDRKLLLLHVNDGRVEPAVAAARFARLADESAAAGLVYRQELLDPGESVHRALRQATPHNPEALMICGTRIKPRRNAFLSGSVAELLLRSHQCPVLALRVVQPGLLGLPRTLLLPVDSGVPGPELMPILRRLAPPLRRLYLLRTQTVHLLNQRHLSSERREELHRAGRRDLDLAAAELAPVFAPYDCVIDRRVLIATEVTQQTLIEASRLKTQILLVATTRRSLASRVLRAEPLERLLRDAPCDVGIFRGP